MHQSLEMPPPWCTLVWRDSQQDTRVLLSLLNKCQSEARGWREQPKYVGFGVTAMPAALMANLGTLFISSKINPTNVAEDSLNTCSVSVRGNSHLAAGAGQVFPPVSRIPKCPGFCKTVGAGQTAQTLPQDSLLKSGEGQSSCWQWPSPLCLLLNHTCQKELNSRAHKNTSEMHFSPSKCTRSH